jgi:hypothetical protein
VRPITLAVSLLLSSVAQAAEPAGCPAGAHLEVNGLGAAGEELERAAQLAGAAPVRSLLIRPGGARRAETCAGVPFAYASRLAAAADDPFARVLPLRFDTVANTRYPSGANDRLLWAGRGLSAQLSGGVAAHWRWLSAALAPEVAWQQNHLFETNPSGGAGDHRFMSPWYGTGIDLPQRFGEGPFATAGFGQSFVRADAFNVGLGFSTENLWLGPGIRSSLLMSDTAPGVPHAFVGTSRPADIWVGKLEALAFWGWLDRSPHFPDGGHPLLTGLALAFEPRWVPGLHVGAARVFVQPGTGLRVRDYFPFLQGPWKTQTEYWSPSGDNPLDNQLGALWLRWVFPASALEIYGEWGKEDYSGSTVNGFIQDPSWTQAWLVGLQKLFRAGSGWIRVQAEATHLQEARGSANPSWYTHGNGLGYTNGGQLIGAGIGPGGDAQTLAVDWLGPSGRIGGYLERIGRNEGEYWNAADPGASAVPGTGHDVELTAAARQLLFAGPLELSWELGLQRRWNRDFLGHEVNLRGAVSLTARFDRPRPATGPASEPAPFSASR